VRAVDVLDGQTERIVFLLIIFDRVEQLHERLVRIPRTTVRVGNNIVTVQCGDRDELEGNVFMVR